jgi:hypothetical protein
LVEGNIGEVQCINRGMLEIVETILDDFWVGRVIILQGDHGLRDENSTQIVRACYLPLGGERNLYPTIPP